MFQKVTCDHVIEDKTGASIPMIFDIEGEDGFRNREQQVIDELTQSPEKVVATGGGAVIREANRKHLRSRGFVVYLKSTVDALVQRTQHDRNRPLLQTDNPAQVLKDLIEQREPHYQEVADVIIETEQVSVHRVVKQIIEQLQAENII
jgi:shikimate kinase